MLTGQSILEQAPKSSGCLRQTRQNRAPNSLHTRYAVGMTPQHYCRLGTGKDRSCPLIVPVCAAAGIFQRNSLAYVLDGENLATS